MPLLLNCAKKFQRQTNANFDLTLWRKRKLFWACYKSAIQRPITDFTNSFWNIFFQNTDQRVRVRQIFLTKLFPGQVPTCPAEWAACPISVHNGWILVAEPLQSQVQEKKDKRTITNQDILKTMNLNKER